MSRDHQASLDRARSAPDPLAKIPLLRNVHRDPDGKPLKTALASKFPMLSRRERRELQRAAIKFQRHKAKLKEVEQC